LIKIGPKKFNLIIDRKSRIIMKDTLIILQKVEKIKEKASDVFISLETTAPVCSKSIKFLIDNGIDIINIPKK